MFRSPHPTVRGIDAPTPRLTVLGAALMAAVLAVILGGALWVALAVLF